jgi:hypothetical protein
MRNYSEAAFAHQEQVEGSPATGKRTISVKQAFNARERAWRLWEAHVSQTRLYMAWKSRRKDLKSSIHLSGTTRISDLMMA